MSRQLRARSGVVLATIVGAALVATAAPAAATSATAVARFGGGYLARQLDAGGGFFGTPDTPDVSDTANAVLALHAAGVGRRQARVATTFLTTQLGAPLQEPDGTDNPGLVGFDILAAVTDNRNPRHFGGTAPENNLVRRLIATQRTTGTDAGLFGDADPTFDGAFRQGIALAALRAAGVAATNPAVVRGTAWLRRQQCANGLWEAYRPDTTIACGPADPTTFTGPDTNSTGLAAQGLAAYLQRPRRAKLIAAMHAARSADGGWAFVAAPGQPSDPDSTALGIQALLAYASAPGQRAFTALASFQLGCADPAADRGAFFFPGSRDPNLLATVQAVPAAARTTLPLPPSIPSAAVPVMPCDTTTAAAAVRTAAPASVQLGTAGPCTGTSGVTVTVDFTAFGGTEQTRCATGAQASGVAALQNAGFTLTGTTQFGLAFICRINNLPSPTQQSCAVTPPATAYWAYYHALSGATTWTYSTLGATSYQPPAGSIEAWAFGDTAQPHLTPAQVRAGD